MNARDPPAQPSAAQAFRRTETPARSGFARTCAGRPGAAVDLVGKITLPGTMGHGAVKLFFFYREVQKLTGFLVKWECIGVSH